MAGSISRGVDYLVRGARMLNHPRLRAFVIIPLLINILVFGTLITLSVNAVGSTMDHWLSAIPDWLSFLRWIIWPIVILALALVTGYAFTAVAVLIASPFNGLLAEKAEELISGQPVQGPEGLMGALAIIPRSIVREVKKLLYYLPLLVLVLILSFIPGLNALSPLLWFLLGAWMMGIQYVDYPMDNHMLDFKDVKEACADNRMSSLGFGGVVSLMASVPILNFFVVPAAVVGATIFWCEEINRPGR